MSVFRMNNAEQKACESDLTNKNHAHAIDDRMQQLRNSSAALGLFPGIEDIDNTYVFLLSQIHITARDSSTKTLISIFQTM